jgi:hypothetical protein
MWWPAIVQHSLQCLDAMTMSTGKKVETQRIDVGRTPVRFKQSKGVKLNGILECKFLSKNAHRTST